jgi:phosphate transport system ATP-binding protein
VTRLSDLNPAYTLGELQEGPPCCEPMPHLQARGLSVSYSGQCVLSDISLNIYRGCITAIIGPSGCGKSTFLSTLNRLTDLIPDVQINGDVLYGGRSIFDGKIDVLSLRRSVGMIFQKPNPFPLSIRQNLELPLREHGERNKETIADKIETALRDVGLWQEVADRLNTSALSLSGGQQQRLCIARALVLEPNTLLMDEPCSALDPIASGVVEELILNLRGRYTVVVVTHNLAQARRVANYAAFFWMKDRLGTLVEFGQSNHLFEQPREELTRAYVSGQRG